MIFNNHNLPPQTRPLDKFQNRYLIDFILTGKWYEEVFKNIYLNKFVKKKRSTYEHLDWDCEFTGRIQKAFLCLAFQIFQIYIYSRYFLDIGACRIGYNVAKKLLFVMAKHILLKIIQMYLLWIISYLLKIYESRTYILTCIVKICV